MSFRLGFICPGCALYRGFDNEHPNAYCAAFPSGVPERILSGFDHRKPTGDEELDSDGNPILFEIGFGPEAEERLAAYERMKPLIAEVNPDVE